MIYPDTFEEKTGFAGIRETLAGSCICSLGREHVESMSFLNDRLDISRKLMETDELRDILTSQEEFPFGNISDATPWLKKLRIEGAFMETDELFRLKMSLDSAKSLVNWFNEKNREKYPGLYQLARGVRVPLYVRERLSSVLTKEGSMKDNASRDLQSIRREIKQKQGAVSGKIQIIMKKAQSDGLAEKDSGVSVRDGRLVIPVNASMKRKIKGFIHDESATGKTVFIEPSEVVELNNEIRELEYAEKREVIKILRELADSIRPYLDELFDVFEFLGLLDFIRAKALFAIKTGGVKPVVAECPVIDWKRAFHPLLYLALKKDNRETVPLDIKLSGEERILVISGPNAGGKSVCLQTIGILQYMLQCGLLVPMSENSESGIFEDIFIDIGDEQSIENDLSTYSSHLMNMKVVLRQSGERSLVLIDEFGTGTEPIIGGAIAEAILEQLNRNRTFGVVTTHYTNLKHFAASTDGLVNGAMLFDTSKMEPLFRLETGKPGSSFAFEIARKIGLSEDILRSAASKAGEDHIDFDRHLKEIIRDKHYWNRKRKNIRKIEKKLEGDIDRYSSLLEGLDREKRDIISSAKEEAGRLLEGVNRRIENTIKEIRESQAEKERTRKARLKLDNFKSRLDDSSEEDRSGKIEKKILQLKEKQKRLKKKSGGRVSAEMDGKRDDSAVEKREGAIGVGDFVRLYGGDISGEVLDVNGPSIMVAFGNMITTVKESRLEKLSRGKSGSKGYTGFSGGSSASFNIRDKKLSFRAERDVRGVRAAEAVEIISRFIDDALMVGSKEVRILHGKGNGILREVIREHLNTVAGVKSFRDEHVELGGSGITVVFLDD